MEKVKNKNIRKEFIKDSFFEGILVDDKYIAKTVSESTLQWMFNLQHFQKIKIKKFKDLFSDLDEIVFPIKLKWAYNGLCTIKIEFLDKLEKEYYMYIEDIYSPKSVTYYRIGRRNSSIEPLIDREFYFKILEDGAIIMEKSIAMKLKTNGENDDILVEYYYFKENNLTKAILNAEKTDKKIEIIYSMLNKDLDNQVLKVLMNSERHWYYYDVFPILKELKNIKNSEWENSFSIVAKIGEQIFSEIKVVEGIVQRYTTTEVKSENELIITTKILAKNLEEFLLK